MDRRLWDLGAGKVSCALQMSAFLCQVGVTGPKMGGCKYGVN